MTSRTAPIEAALTGMHARFPDTFVHKREHEVTITCDMLQFWLRTEPLADRLYEFTLSFVREDVQRWTSLAVDQGIEHFNIEFHPSSLWREMSSILGNPEYVGSHPVEGLDQLIQDLRNMLRLAEEARAHAGHA